MTIQELRDEIDTLKKQLAVSPQESANIDKVIALLELQASLIYKLDQGRKVA